MPFFRALDNALVFSAAVVLSRLYGMEIFRVETGEPVAPAFWNKRVTQFDVRAGNYLHGAK